MSDLVPAAPPAVAARAADRSRRRNALARLRGFTGRVRSVVSCPGSLALAAIGGAGLTWAILAPSPQRMLYSQLDDSERATVVAALDKAAITYEIDNQTGSLSVAEGDYYQRAHAGRIRWRAGNAGNRRRHARQTADGCQPDDGGRAPAHRPRT